MIPLPLPGAVQVPIPHSGSDVLSTPKYQPSLPEFQGGTEAPFLLSSCPPSTPSETRTQSRSLWPPSLHLAHGLLLGAGLTMISSLLPYQTIPLKLNPPTHPRPTPAPALAPHTESMVTFSRGLASFLQASYPSPPVFPQHCAPVYQDALSFQTSLALTTTPRPVGEVLRYPAPSPHSSLPNFSASEANPSLALETPALPCLVYQIFTGSLN